MIREALDTAGVRYTIDFIDYAVHGFAPPGTERYNRRASELHWERCPLPPSPQPLVGRPDVPGGRRFCVSVHAL